MRISKHVHSCLVLEEQGQRLLFDPGVFSFVEGLVRPEDFENVATIVLTHSHPDHVDVEALRRIVALSGADVLTNRETAQWLETEGLHPTVVEDGTHVAGPFTVRAVSASHEAILSESLPLNTAYIVNERVLNPGDSFSPTLIDYAGVASLILPVTAPWLTEVDAFTFAKMMRPQLVIPVHDGYAKDFFRRTLYARFESYLARSGVGFASLMEPGESIEAM